MIERLTINLAQIWVAGGGGYAVPHPPAFRRAPPPRPPKRRSAPFAAAVGFFSLGRATCLGQLRCQGQNFLPERRRFFEELTCPEQLRCMGQNFPPQNSDFFLKKSLVRGSCAAWGRAFPRKLILFCWGITCPGQLRCLGRNFSQKF